MKTIMKRSVGIVLSLVLCLSIVFGVSFTANAATVDYVYADGKFIKNWGTREVEATFLSPNAEAFYKDNNTSYAKLSSYSGAAQNDVRSTSLYKELNSLMKKNHTFVTDYGYTRYKFQYTDIENSGKTSDKISSFYSGNPIGPNWDSAATWNREHIWPNSKGEGQGENDIMMLRPTAINENGGRGNAAYGKSSGYYNPNSESGGKHDLRGDVARIVLYQHVRWEQSKLFGSSGVIESRAVLLEWMEADPVDTWELGRNDAVESITGTRNVFVDYPELAFVLFGEQVPSDYTTPSGNAKNGTTLTPTPDNTQNDNQQNNNQQSNTQSTTSNNNQGSTQNNNNNQATTSSNTQSSNTQTNTQSGNTTNTSCKHTKAYAVAEEAARCDTEGYTAGKYCPDCKQYISGHKQIAAAGHTYAGDCDTDCDVCDEAREVEAEHTYDDKDVCMVCGISKDAVENNDITTGVIDTDDDKTDDNEQESNKKGFPWIITIIAVVVVVIVGGGVLVYIYREKIWPKEIEESNY